jgi:hypothetical protein
MFLAEGRPVPAKEETMTRLGYLIQCAAFGLSAALLGCGSNTPSGGGGATSALQLVPASNAVAGWKFNASNSKTANGAATATTEVDTEALIDGAAAEFFAAPYAPVQFAWETYVNATISTADTASPAWDQQFPDGAAVDLKILQLPSAAQASGLYASLKPAALYAKYDSKWADPSSPKVGTDSRVVDTGDHWWINFYQGNFSVEVSMGPSYNPPPDYIPGNTVTQAAAFAFAAAVAGKI